MSAAQLLLQTPHSSFQLTHADEAIVGTACHKTSMSGLTFIHI